MSRRLNNRGQFTRGDSYLRSDYVSSMNFEPCLSHVNSEPLLGTANENGVFTSLILPAWNPLISNSSMKQHFSDFQDKSNTSPSTSEVSCERGFFTSQSSLYSDVTGSVLDSKFLASKASSTVVGNSSDSGSEQDVEEQKKSCIEGVEIFVGGLPRSTSNEMLYEWFKRIAEPIEVRVARDKRRRRCRGYGHVRFRTSAQANRAIDTMQSFQFKRGCFLGILPCDENRTLYINGICETWQKDQISAFFYEKFNGIKSLQLVWNREDSSRLRPFCFVEFDTHENARSSYEEYHQTEMDAHSDGDCTTADIQTQDCTTFDTDFKMQHLIYKETELKVEWADPLRYFIHLYGGVNRHTIQISNNSSSCSKKSLQTSKVPDTSPNHLLYSHVSHESTAKYQREAPKGTAVSESRPYTQRVQNMQSSSSYLNISDHHQISNWQNLQNRSFEVPKGSHFKELNGLNCQTGGQQFNQVMMPSELHYSSHNSISKNVLVQKRLQEIQAEALLNWKNNDSDFGLQQLNRSRNRFSPTANNCSNSYFCHEDSCIFPGDYSARSFSSEHTLPMRDIRVNSSHTSNFSSCSSRFLPDIPKFECSCLVDNTNSGYNEFYDKFEHIYCGPPGIDFNPLLNRS